MSDLLLKSFPRHELKAVLSHEAGHVRMNHLPIRIGFLLLPALAMVCLESDHNQTLQSLINATSTQISFRINASAILGLVFVGYVCAITCWLSRNMEFEADLYAVGAFGSVSKGNDDKWPNAAQAMSDALLRFAKENPDQLTRRSMTHPSLMDRIDVIKRFVQEPGSADHFRKKFVMKQIVIASLIFAITTILVAV